ncbi:MAG: glycoside hydrolase family 127 protein [Verrucomicrobia bacterium]|nr:glycoside hydrolase family 127 protein [Verrucomicrobiota bacterium]
MGRALLALTLHARLFREVPPHLGEFVARMPEAFNARGYIGEIHPTGTADENQIGGHNALLRGLSEYYRWRGDPRALAAIRSVVRGLMLPVRPLFAQYPDRLLKELVKAEAIGLTVRQATGPWRGLSTDIGTVFFTLDGLTQAYLCERTPELRALIETMIARFAEIDSVAIRAQTHATLTTLRGIFRWWREVDPRPELLELVRGRFAAYRRLAQTENHANTNWFGRPDWTEPCAVVDSLMLAVQLWSATGDGELLEEAHRIFYNAFLFGQRPGGGFGCDLCVGHNGQRYLAPHPKIFEAAWCCTMRGAEGFASAARHAWWHNGADGIALPFYFGGNVRLHLAEGDIELAQDSEYPMRGRVSLRVVRGRSTTPVELRWFAPTWSPPESFRVARNGAEISVGREERWAVVRTPLATGDVVVAEFAVKFGAVSLQNAVHLPGERRWAHGPLLLALSAEEREAMPGEFGGSEEFLALGAARYRCVRTGREIAPLPALTEMNESTARAQRVQVVFPRRAP